MVKGIRDAMATEVASLQWMDAPTRQAANEKITAMEFLIGYPDKWRTYDVKLERGSFAKNVMAVRELNFDYEMEQIGKPVDKGRWHMSPPTVNAYYNPSMNEMVFPAGILQPPFFAKSNLPAVNYGAIGMVMGHELTHGFDDEGAKFDAKGNLRDWWSASTARSSDRRRAAS